MLPVQGATFSGSGLVEQVGLPYVPAMFSRTQAPPHMCPTNIDSHVQPAAMAIALADDGIACDLNTRCIRNIPRMEGYRPKRAIIPGSDPYRYYLK